MNIAPESGSKTRVAISSEDKCEWEMYLAQASLTHKLFGKDDEERIKKLEFEEGLWNGGNVELRNLSSYGLNMVMKTVILSNTTEAFEAFERLGFDGNTVVDELGNDLLLVAIANIGIKRRSEEVFIHLLERYPSMIKNNKRTSKENALMMLSVTQDQTPFFVLENLVKKGFSTHGLFNGASYMGLLCRHASDTAPTLQKARFLIGKGLNLEKIEDDSGLTLLITTAKSAMRNAKLARLLLDSGACSDHGLVLPGFGYSTPLSYARAMKNTGVENELLKGGGGNVERRYELKYKEADLVNNNGTITPLSVGLYVPRMSFVFNNPFMSAERK